MDPSSLFFYLLPAEDSDSMWWSGSTEKQTAQWDYQGTDLMKANTCGGGYGEGTGQCWKNSQTVMAIWPPVKERGRGCWIESSGSAKDPEKVATRPLGRDVRAHWGRVSQQRSSIALRNGPVLVSLPDSATGWVQPRGMHMVLMRPRVDWFADFRGY